MREMKDSGIEWVGQIGLDYKLIKLKYICQILDEFRKPISAEKRNQESDILYDYYGASGAIDKIDGYTIDDHVMLIGEDGANLRMRNLPLMYEVNGKAWINNHAHIIKPNNNMNFYFLFYALESLDINPYVTGSAQPKLNQENLKLICVPVTDYEHQNRIADYIRKKCTEIDSLISDIQQQIETLEQYKRSIITEAVTKGLDPDVEMRDSEIEFIGKVPKHWEIRRMKTLGTVRNGLTYTPQDICDENEGTLVLRSSNVQNGKISLNDNVYVSCEIKSDLMVKYGDILICSRNGSRELIGKNAIIKNLNATFGAFMMIFRSESPEYLYYILNSHVFSYYLGTFFTSTINQLTGFNFGNMKVAFCPNVCEQQKIVEYLDKKCIEIDGIITEKKQQIETIEEYKKSLIFEYVTGKKEVKVR